MTLCFSAPAALQRKAAAPHESSNDLLVGVIYRDVRVARCVRRVAAGYPLAGGEQQAAQLEPAWAADTQRRIHAMGKWPANIPYPHDDTKERPHAE